MEPSVESLAEPIPNPPTVLPAPEEQMPEEPNYKVTEHQDPNVENEGEGDRNQEIFKIEKHRQTEDNRISVNMKVNEPDQ